MSAPGDSLARSLKQTRIGVLVILGVCALVIGSAPERPDSAPVDPRSYQIVAIALAAGSILGRGAIAGRNQRLRVYLTIGSLLCAAGIGLVGVALSMEGGPQQIALLYTLGGALLSLRPFPPAAPGG